MDPAAYADFTREWVAAAAAALHHPRRVFNPPADLPAARSGVPYPLDWWPENGRADRPGLYRYDNSLPLPLVLRIIRALTCEGHLVVDPCVGSGTSAVASYLTNRRFAGGDVNPAAVMFSAARLLAEHAWVDDRQPGLFPAQRDRCCQPWRRPADMQGHPAGIIGSIRALQLREPGRVAALSMNSPGGLGWTEVRSWTRCACSRGRSRPAW